MSAQRGANLELNELPFKVRANKFILGPVQEPRSAKGDVGWDQNLMYHLWSWGVGVLGDSLSQGEAQIV